MTPVDLQQRAIAHIQSRFSDAFRRTDAHQGQHWVEVERSAIVAVLRSLRDDLGFDVLMDLTCVDWLGKETPERYSMVYQLFSFEHRQYFRVKCWLPADDLEVDSASAIWKSAPWAEREVWDMFGVRFRGLDDHRRLLTPIDYTGHPLRKDYPLIGHGERSNFPHYVK